MTIRQTVGGYILEAKVYASAFREGRRLGKKTGFYIFGQGRTGSTLLVRMLGAHKDIHCEDELLFHRRLFPLLYVRGKLAVNEEPVVGFHVKCYQLTQQQGYKNARTFVERLQREGWKMIFLRRKDVFRHAISPILAKARNLWHLGEDGKVSPEPPAVALNPNQVVAAVRMREEYGKMEKAIVRDFDHFRIVYEDHLQTESQREAITPALCRYLGVEESPLSCSLKRTTGASLAKAISNIEEIETAMKQAGYGCYLQDLE